MTAVGFVTCKDAAEAKTIAAHVLEAKLAVCANIISPVESMYRFKGKIETATEALLILKTNPDKVSRLISAIEAIHSYETPAIEFFNIDRGSPKTQLWVNAELK